MKTRIPYLYSLLLALVATAGFQSCTKTEYTDYEAEPLNHMLEYRVTNAQQELLGAINHEENTITVYIPYYSGLEYLDAEIKIDEGAKLLDSAGKEIDLDGGIDPVQVNADSVTVKYTVVPDEGEKRTYTLIQKILPTGDSLSATYELLEEGETELRRAVNSRLVINGNFESSSANAKFYLTDKATGKVYDDFISGEEMTPGENNYTFMTNISPEALAGDYTVRMEHQGRETALPDLKLYYVKYPSTRGYLASASYFAPGDTLTFSVDIAPPDYNTPSILPDIDRMYVKIRKEGSFAYEGNYAFEVPAGFPESQYDKEFEMKIVSQNRREIKVLLPDLPAGQYLNNNSVSETDEETGAYVTQDTNFGFYVDFAEGTGFPRNYILATASSTQFTVNEKK